LPNSTIFQSLHEAANAIEGATILSGTSRVALAEQVRQRTIEPAMLDAIEREARRVAQACSYVRGILNAGSA
jgi:hypothetical protein